MISFLFGDFMRDFEKYTYEIFPVECDFSPNMEDDETLVLASSSVEIYDESGTDRTSTMIVAGSEQVEGQTLKAKVTGGVKDAIYTVKFKVLTSASNKYQQDKTLYVMYETV